MLVRHNDFAKTHGLEDSNVSEPGIVSLMQSIRKLEITPQGKLLSPCALLDEIINESERLVLAFGRLIKDMTAVFIYADEANANDSCTSRFWVIFSVSEAIHSLDLLIRICKKLKLGESWPSNSEMLPSASMLSCFIGLPFIKLAQQGVVNIGMLEKIKRTAEAMEDHEDFQLSDFTEAFNEAYETGEIEDNVQGSLQFMRLWAGMIDEMSKISFEASNLLFHHSQEAA